MSFFKKQNVLVLFLCTSICIGMLGCKKEEEKPEQSFTADSSIITDEESARAAANKVPDPNQRVRFTITYTGGFKFPSGKLGTEGTGNIENSLDNEDAAYLTLTLNNEEIVKTGLIPVGAKLKKFTLLKDVPAGKHEVIMVYNIVDEERQIKIGESAAISMDLIIEE